MPHVLQRSVARNQIRAGVSEGVVMKLCGWSTRAMLARYDVTAAQDLGDGVEKLGDYLSQRSRAATVNRAAKG